MTPLSPEYKVMIMTSSGPNLFAFNSEDAARAFMDYCQGYEIAEIKLIVDSQKDYLASDYKGGME